MVTTYSEAEKRALSHKYSGEDILSARKQLGAELNVPTEQVSHFKAALRAQSNYAENADWNKPIKLNLDKSIITSPSMVDASSSLPSRINSTPLVIPPQQSPSPAATDYFPEAVVPFNPTPPNVRPEGVPDDWSYNGSFWYYDKGGIYKTANVDSWGNVTINNGDGTFTWQGVLYPDFNSYKAAEREWALANVYGGKKPSWAGPGW